MENILGYAVKQIRKEKKITQEQLAKTTGFAQSTISNHENGNRALDEIDIQVYSEALRVSPQTFFDIVHGKASDNKTVIHGNNNGIANLSGNVEGGLTINNHEQDEHSVAREVELADNSSEDLDIQKTLAKQFAEQIALQKQTISLLEQILQELRK